MLAAILIGSCDTLETLAGAALIQRYIGVPNRIERWEDVIAFMALAAASATIAATIGMVPIAIANAFPAKIFARSFSDRVE